MIVETMSAAMRLVGSEVTANEDLANIVPQNTRVVNDIEVPPVPDRWASALKSLAAVSRSGTRG
jgi:hypothetical protein